MRQLGRLEPATSLHMSSSTASHDTPIPRWRDRLRERWFAWRDRVLTDPGFQRRAVRSWWLRPVARHRARGLFDLVSGFVYSQILLSCVRLRVMDKVAHGPQTLTDLARHMELSSVAAQRLLDAAVALQLLEHRGTHRGEPRYGLGVLGAPLVGNEAVLALIEHHSILYDDLREPVDLLKGQGPTPGLQQYWAYATNPTPATLPPERVQAYCALMSASQPLVAQEVLDAYPLDAHRCLMDVGGGQGRFAAAAALRAPGLQVRVFDLPTVVPAAAEHLAHLGLSHRSQVLGGDFTRDALPTGADVISLIRVLYDHGDERVLTLLRKVYDALPPGGTVLVAEPMAAATGAARMGDAYFGFYLLAMGSGRPRSAGQLAHLLGEAGFEQVRERPTPIPLQVGVVVAHKPRHPSIP